jgi:hypothetical protein
MSLNPTAAEGLLRARLGEPINPVPTGQREGEDNDKVLGFATASGRVLALNRKIGSETHIWFEPPESPVIDGVSLRPQPTINSNLSGSLAVLNHRRGMQAEIETEAALHRFLDWYESSSRGVRTERPTAARLEPNAFRAAFDRFVTLIAAYDKGHAFMSFREGLAGVWENYKPLLRDRARDLLATETWHSDEIGQGLILERTIAAIEIQDTHKNLINNLVFWQNRFGHSNRDHRALLEAQNDRKSQRIIEELLFDFYRGDADEGLTFERLCELTDRKYPLLAYLFFLEDINRFMPIQPTGFDRAFRELGVDFVTLRNCGWENYARYNTILGEVRVALETIAGLKNIRLVDAHSFCWILATLLKLEAEGSISTVSGRKDSGRILGARERSILDLKFSIIQTAQQSRGQTVERTVQMKVKDLGLDTYELEAHVRELMKMQGDRCALTGIPFQFKDDGADPNLLPSPDRIDSEGHYESGNIQIVCRFVNFWKAATPNDEFVRLLMLVRGLEE